MAFTGEELARGGVFTWLVFLALVALVIVVPELASTLAAGWAGILAGDDAGAIWSSRIAELFGGLQYLLMALVICGLVAAIVALAITPLAGLVGRGLARVRRRAIHLCAYFGLGAVVGGAIALGIGALTRFWYPPFLVATTIITAVATATGWWLTARAALRADAGRASTGSDPS